MRVFLMLYKMLTLVQFRNKVFNYNKILKKKIFIGCGSCFLLCVIFYANHRSIKNLAISLISATDEDISCYDEPQTLGSTEYFNKGEEQSMQDDHNIFFHETSCFGDREILLNARQACAVESAAKMNPGMKVYLSFLSHRKFSNYTKMIIDILMSYKNVHIHRISMDRYVKDTPLEEWWASGVFKSSRWPRSHMSDILRYLTLWKYPGIYLDLDVVVISSLEHLSNFAGAEDWEDVAAGVLGFGANQVGRRIADACLRDLKKNFRGDIWGNNGPGVITRILQRICAAKYAQDMTKARCHGFNVYPPSTFYPIHYKKWKLYFDAKKRNETLRMIEKALIIHVWNKLSQFETIRIGSDVPYAIIANQYCPKIFNNCSKFF
ncbi:lactosylceramide 4-alpha-galactosyltransferase-like isoform X2 [Chelonus insularis]|uniref:lactosylceramide 4-alpha-galactosyltransferase-like isoform X2 n=1 Tax=Chelonus insularis TaxID=460826 RepID=UPI00158CFC8E|nr:lactosylceramide 4-alpha-galactosyltransferase-like isoform X2 [Chelonus insularis]